ncbi:hypothetical protein UF64_09685 [Thalassospira sp. HJ]|uniref:helix-turn-helix domain-containing protein n=1 Tax=Thalassospira sp. HJ TaxID=1616823 RepID=UPI0005CF65A6|nr:hypothetical protein UF64_09685 [Thalassospira sp. HJ]
MSKLTSIHNEKYRKLIKNLVAARKRAGINQVELAEQLGLSQPDISKIERCERRLDALEFLELVDFLAKHLQVSTTKLVVDVYEANS